MGYDLAAAVAPIYLQVSLIVGGFQKIGSRDWGLGLGGSYIMRTIVLGIFFVKLPSR